MNDVKTINNNQFVYIAGDKACDNFGNSVSDDKFLFVQQDKKLHDVKFTTKPTTFLKDALKRFGKNKSSVTGGIILGVLFLLAIIVPFAVPFNITKLNNYETNLPMKLFPTGSGFWDGTTKLVNQALPYKLNDDGSINYEKLEDGYTQDDVKDVVKISDVSKGYVDVATTSGQGGYATIDKDPAGGNDLSNAFLCCYPFDFDIVGSGNKYTATFTLGTREQTGYTTPNWAFIVRGKGLNDNGDEVDNIRYLLTDYSDDYGKEVEKEDSLMTVTPHESITLNINDLLNEKIQSKAIPHILIENKFSVGFQIKAKDDYRTAFYLHDFELRGTTSSGNALSGSAARELKARSFGTKNSAVRDANAMVLEKQKMQDGSTNNAKYWTQNSDLSFTSSDTYSAKCSMRVDRYSQAYGIKSITFFNDKFDEWINKGYIEYDYNVGAKSFKITDKGKQSQEVYVTEVEKQQYQEKDEDVVDSLGNKVYKTYDSDVKDDYGNVIHKAGDFVLDSKGNKVVLTHKVPAYALTCKTIMYKYLGYKSMPYHIFGTDGQGRDMFKYVFSGLRTSLILAVAVAAFNIIFGIIWGSISGYFGGTTDLIMERITDVLSGIPSIILMTALTLLWGPTTFVFALSLCLTSWIGTASTTRSQFYRYRDREYVLASKTLGARSPRLIFRHILPNAMGTIVTSSVLMIPSVIFSEATLSYIGLGIKNADSLGRIMSDGQKVLSSYPYQLIFPAVIMALLMICFNLFGNGLRDAVNPSLKGSE